jgi:thiol-disulfide isomerase/thioredoxin
MKHLITALICLSSFSTLQAQQLKLKPGDEFAMTTHSTQALANEKKPFVIEDYTFQFTTIAATATEYKLQCRLLKAKKWHINPLERVNSDSLRITDLNNSGLLIQLILLQRPFTVYVGSNGQFLRTEGIPELIAEAIKPWHLYDDLLPYQQPNIEGFLTLLNGVFFELPPQKLTYGATWTNATNKVNYKVSAMRGSLLDVMQVTDDKNTEALFSINDVNGLVENARSSFTQTNVPEAKRFQASETISYGKSAAPAIDTAWLNMAIPMSYWSKWFKNVAGNGDSAKIFAYFRKHDPAFSNDPFYAKKKLSLVQTLKGEYKYREYDKIINKTGNHILANESSHLHNKLQNASSTNADSAYAIIQYFYKTSSFDEWVHQSFAQHFLRESEVSNQLLALLNADKKPAMQAMVNPLYLWVKSKDQPNNIALLLKAYNRYMRMNDTYMHKGDGARYAILNYKMLLKAGRIKEASKLLDRTTQTLERFNADTLNKYRLADRNILAYAYYLKYQDAVKTDTATALGYLAKAAQYSPLNIADRAYASFYDRVFLDSKESYAEEFMKKLFAMGNTDTALKIFADNITANPGRIDDMQKMFEKQFKDKNFADFFMSNVTAKWPDAPAFELTDLNGKKVSLADHKNKWLAIDFWGTWCSPCRDEMPIIDGFNKELLDGKHTGIELLSIACSDNLNNVKNYITNNNFGIPVVMSDRKVEENYKITGYPTKILISPNGKMIEVPKADWITVIKKFNKLYAAN